MKKIKTISLLISILMLGTIFASCGAKTTSDGVPIATDFKNAPKKPDFVTVGENGSRTAKTVGFQLEKPGVGEEIAILHIKDMGDIRLRLFPEEAPIAVANFKALISEGYYDGLTFHRIDKDFMIQGGDPDGTGGGGQSVWGEDFGYEFNKNLLHFRGALSMAHSTKDASNGSQFFIVQNKKLDVQIASNYETKAAEIYNKRGGTPWLDGGWTGNQDGHTVFGQAFEQDLEVVDAIADLENSPRSAIIEKAEIVKYKQ